MYYDDLDSHSSPSKYINSMPPAYVEASVKKWTVRADAVLPNTYCVTSALHCFSPKMAASSTVAVCTG